MKGKCRNCSTQLPMDENTSCPECHSGDPFGITATRDLIDKIRKEVMGRFYKGLGILALAAIIIAGKMPAAEPISVLLLVYMVYLLFEVYFKQVKKELFPMFDAVFEITEDEEAQKKISTIVKDATKRLFIPDFMAYENDKLVK